MEFLPFLSQLFGWVYFFAWSLSFYPQPWLSYSRGTTSGTTIDFPFLNNIGNLPPLLHPLVSYARQTVSLTRSNNRILSLPPLQPPLLLLPPHPRAIRSPQPRVDTDSPIQRRRLRVTRIHPLRRHHIPVYTESLVLPPFNRKPTESLHPRRIPRLSHRRQHDLLHRPSLTHPKRYRRRGKGGLGMA